ncbi:MAG: FumA C-terminus/TtdB family hydratase beta subunit [Treponema sp.]|nr:FumA C-terminus/TtdB family hydratase beta subunit [Treponema sp.]MCL2271314.1 FumA C-terminus/TtdB family hydratase beta subunit [Treponema sp.]
MKIIELPCKDQDIRSLRAGDIFSLSGLLVTGRDEVYHRVVEERITPPVDLKGMAICHAGPIVKEKPDGGYEIVAIGPTSSIRMEKWASDFIKKTGVKIMIGKGAMGEKTATACKTYGAIHCVYPGGCAVLGASQIEKIEDCIWKEFGMAESMWVMRTQSFGPLIVSIDTQGNNLFMENSLHYNREVVQKLKN